MLHGLRPKGASRFFSQYSEYPRRFCSNRIVAEAVHSSQKCCGFGLVKVALRPCLKKNQKLLNPYFKARKAQIAHFFQGLSKTGMANAISFLNGFNPAVRPSYPDFQKGARAGRKSQTQLRVKFILEIKYI